MYNMCIICVFPQQSLKEPQHFLKGVTFLTHVQHPTQRQGAFPSPNRVSFNATIAAAARGVRQTQQKGGVFHGPGIIKWDPFQGNQSMQVYGSFEGFSFQ